ncbi:MULTISPECIES: hypothetical protein [Nocardioides]|uniref:Uncharacterized protein n=1 Tax=Nocardioides vastitatis TaxID=2568655 RepID=A0ABW0ZK72_9ACTN|nr:hypothetical protein [Nocardioides sp.]THJ03801.1 hypothetical protein E7Z54_09465 [Nocardioides sp.]
MTVVDALLRWSRMSLTSLRTAITVGALTMLVGFAAVSLMTAPQAPVGGAEKVGLSSTPLNAMMERHRCSFTGFDREAVPSKAIVRTPEGETRLVSFDHGWAVFIGEAAGELVAVCLGAETREKPEQPR